MTLADRMKMCLAEAGFVEGHQYKAMYGLEESDGYIILYSEGHSPLAMQKAIGKARELCGLPSWEDAEPYQGQFTCGGI